MKTYIAPDNSLWAYEEDGSQDHLIPSNYILITEEQAEIHRQQLAVERFAALTYTEKRIESYPNFREYLDGIVKGDQAQIDKYIADCLAVKAKYPKE
jgi:hypothetical protein